MTVPARLHLRSQRMAKNATKISVLTTYPSFSVMDSASPPVSPTVVAQIFTALVRAVGVVAVVMLGKEERVAE